MDKTTAEVLDGYSIAYLKSERIPSEDTMKNYKRYQEAIEEIKTDYKFINWDVVIKSFIEVNSTIWKYEAEIRQGLLDGDLEEIGRRAVLIREFNQLRVGLGNIVSIFLNEGMLNYKKDHVSAGNE